MPPYVYEMYKLVKHFGANKVLDQINLAFYAGAKIGVVGDNGSGKSTLLHIMAGLDDNFQGHSAPLKGITVTIVQQEPHLNPNKTVREHLLESFSSTQTLINEYNQLAETMVDLEPGAMEKALEKLANLQEKIDAVDGWNLDNQIERAAEALFMPDDSISFGRLSGGEKRRVAIGKALLANSDILLLDEPTNHLDAETVEWLEKQLREYEGTVIIVTHDRYFLDNVTKWILELENTKGIPWEGNYSNWLNQKISLLSKESKPNPKLAIYQREQAWLNLTTIERSKINQSHIADYEKKLQHTFEIKDQSIEIQIAPAPRLGDKVIVMNCLSKSYGQRVLIRDLDFIMPRGAVVGVIGPNGAGKTTLFNLISGTETADSGSIELGDSVQLAYVDQHRDALDANNSVYEEITGGLDFLPFGNKEINSRSYVGKFGFKGSDQQKKIGKLSGGERNRVHLAKLLRMGGNFLLLDEPTNDLDISTLRLLELAIIDFTGSVMVISHDRYFLDRICTHILAFEGEGKVRWFEGNFAAYEAQRRKELGNTFDRPRRSLYRSLT